MITETSMYWITRLDHISEAVQYFGAFIFCMFFVASAAAVAASIIYLIEKYDYDEEESELKLIAKVRNIAFTIAFAVLLPLKLILSTVLVFIPSTKEYCAIKVVPAIVNNEKIQSLGNEFYKLGIEWIKELSPKSEVEKPKTAED